MKFVIVGFGRVGRRTARILQSEAHDVSVVEQDAEKADRAREEGFRVIHGDGGDEDILEQARLDDADAVAALSGDLNTNFSVCVLGEAHDCRTVLRVDEEVSGELYEKYAADVDEIIYPERLGAAGAKTALMGGDFNVLADLTENLSIASVTIPEGSPVISERVIEVELPGNARIYAHGREHESMSIPLPRTAIEPGDSLAVMADPSVLSEVRDHLRGETAQAEN
jgi:trk system potassium uptake protein TrkA